MKSIKEILTKLNYQLSKTKYKLVSVVVRYELRDEYGNAKSHTEHTITVKSPLKFIHVSGYNKWECADNYIDSIEKHLRKVAKAIYREMIKNKWVQNQRSEYKSEIIKQYAWKLQDVKSEELTFDEWKKHRGEKHEKKNE